MAKIKVESAPFNFPNGTEFLNTSQSIKSNEPNNSSESLDINQINYLCLWINPPSIGSIKAPFTEKRFQRKGITRKCMIYNRSSMKCAWVKDEAWNWSFIFGTRQEENYSISEQKDLFHLLALCRTESHR